MNDRILLETMLRNDFVFFTQRCFQTVVPGQQFLLNWHIEAIAFELMRILRRENNRLIITLPPRNLKSICASVAYPAFSLGRDPSMRIVCASYSQELTTKHSRDNRAIMEQGWYRTLFPGTRINPRKNTETEFETTKRGYRFGTSVGGTLTGRGGSTIIIDDPMKPGEAMSATKRAAVAEWYDLTLSSRLDDKRKDAIVIIMQRLHVDDLVGHLLAKGNEWTHLNLPAIAEVPQRIQIGPNRFYERPIGELLHPAREPQSVLDELKVSMGSQAFSAQYQQAPVPPGGALVKADWFRTYDQRPSRQGNDKIIQSWDTAAKANNNNDFSVCTTWLQRGTDHYLLDVLRKRLEFPDLLRCMIERHRKFQPKAVLIEDASTGQSLIQLLKREGRIRPIAIKVDRDKNVRLESQSATIEAGHVLLPRSAPWLGDFLNEVLSFPYGRFDDQVDSMSQYLAWVNRPMSRVHIG